MKYIILFWFLSFNVTASSLYGFNCSGNVTAFSTYGLFRYHLTLTFDENEKGKYAYRYLSVDTNKIIDEGRGEFSFHLIPDSEWVKIHSYNNIKECGVSHRLNMPFNSCLEKNDDFLIRITPLANAIRLSDEYSTFVICAPLP